MIDIEKLREDLINYFGTAMSYNPMAMMELEEVRKASPEKLIEIAKKNGFKPENYKVKGR